LPPAGKNFYDFPDKNTFIKAQKNGSMVVDSPSMNKYNLHNMKNKQMYKIEEGK
jgi:hypothetical protein